MPYKNIEKRKEHAKEYYLKNKDKIIVRSAISYENNKEEKKEYSRNYFKKNRGKVLKDMEKYRNTNKEKYRKGIDKWMLAHKEEYKAWKKKWTREYAKKNRATIYARDVKRRELKRNSKDETTDMEKIKKFYILAETLTEQMGEKYCVDHIFPIIKGGRHHQDNLQVITLVDNLKKGSKYPFEVANRFIPDEIFFRPDYCWITHT
jgi:5-methylcytosine-specific restriction endonuclease McrA